MVGDHDGFCACFFGFQGAFDGHDSFDNEGHAGGFPDGAKLFHGFASGGWVQVLKERQTCGIDVHGYGEGMGVVYQSHFFTDGFDIPGFDGGDTKAACVFDGFGGCYHDVTVGAVAGEGCNAEFGAGGYQNVVVAYVIQGVAVVEIHCTYGAGEERIFEGFAEQVQAGVDGTLFCQGVHLDADFLPFVIVADGGVADAFGAGAGHFVAAGAAVAFGTGLADFADTVSCVFDAFIVVHGRYLFFM